MDLGTRLKQLRNEKGLTQEELGKKINVSKASISLYEKNMREPSRESLLTFANYFDVTTDYLLGNTTSRQGKAPDWADEQDKNDLKKFLEENENSMTYGGENLTDEEREQVKHVLEGVFWKHQRNYRNK
ncbi:helix-turn-helix domain-containing protein [Lentilactobacillus buchneri]|uniref:helix-turn-helix domain-containing protein n=1 Tax=Lentilactobacillus buchneri TaxID=1581 RepID=UPI0021A39E14|nr:helix-turn-helix transcriptional regulator [Lentilactobacillus buchneri]MCT2882633.1 XRE family transcriptional regulator [Lentilactobacillus buchneri]